MLLTLVRQRKKPLAAKEPHASVQKFAHVSRSYLSAPRLVHLRTLDLYSLQESLVRGACKHQKKNIAIVVEPVSVFLTSLYLIAFFPICIY